MIRLRHGKKINCTFGLTKGTTQKIVSLPSITTYPSGIHITFVVKDNLNALLRL